MIAFFLNKWFILFLGILFMLAGLKPDWTMWIVRQTGKMGWAESSVGRGGTFTIWKLIGIIAPIAAIVYFISGGVKIESKTTQNTYDYADESESY
jgi:hypothetical protein